MHPVALFDLVTFLCSFTALVLLFAGWKRALRRDAKLLLAGFFTLLMFYGL